MRLVATSAEPSWISPRSALVVAGIGAVGLMAVAPEPAPKLVPAAVVAVGALLAYKSLASWKAMISLILLVIMFIPIRRYTTPVNLPFQLEPYRVLVMLVCAGWLSSLLIDRRVRLRSSGFEAPLLAYMAAVLCSVVANTSRIDALGVQSDVVKALTFFASFVLVYYLIVSVVRSVAVVDAMLRLLVVSGVVVALCAVFESRTGYNIFNHLHSFIPVLRLYELPDVPGRGARLRVYASAQHPIALGAMLVMLVPIAIYLNRRSGQRRWLLATFLLALGALGTISRTSVMMLVVEILVFLWLRPVETKRILPALVPFLIVAHVAVPGALGSLTDAFFPKGGLVAEQAADPGSAGAGRVADLGPAQKQFLRQPLLGEGYGTRVTDQGKANADVLDDEWLGTLLETGLVGVIALVWLFVRTVRRCGRAARADASADGWRFAAIAASIAAFAVGMWTYDAFSFIQVTFLAYVLVAFASIALRAARSDVPAARAT